MQDASGMVGGNDIYLHITRRPDGLETLCAGLFYPLYSRLNAATAILVAPGFVRP